MDLDQALQTFILESRELLADMESALLQVEQAEDRGDLINAIFRAAHTIKGSAGLFGLDHIVAFTHGVESVLDQVRDGSIEINDRLVILLLSCCDHISAMVALLEAGQLEADEATTRRGTPLLDQLRVFLGVAHAPPQPVTASQADSRMVDRIENASDSHNHWHISLRFGPDVLRNGMDPLSFIRYLARLGTIVGMVTLPDAMPAAAEMDPESCYLGFEIAFDSTAEKREIENVFEFVQDDCTLRILPPNSRVSEYIRLIQELPEEPRRLGEILVQCGSATAKEIEEALNIQMGSPSPPAQLGEILIESGTVGPAVVEAALSKQQHVSEVKSQESRTVRVDADKLDYLINLVGELITAGANVNLVARRANNAELQESTSALTSLVEDLRDSALQLRMVKIGGTFSRFQRVVHDVSREIGKDIRLAISGEETELDKTVVEKIADPLMHLVRNAMDHGIEPGEIRTARGKPARGTVRLNAFHDSGSIVIEVSDDGGGLKRDRILAKAVERGLIEPGRTMSDSEIFNLIFEPGFSTAEQITNLSGRGVGMDVVKRNIVALRGSISIQSEEGVGTTVGIRLPLTLAIIDGFQVGLGKSVFVIPLDMVEECIEHAVEEGRDYTNLRGQVLPFIRLREMFQIEGEPPRRESIVVVKYAGQKVGLVVDALLGEFQTVIKPMGKMFSHLKCISGSSILGSGEVALIVDVSALCDRISSKDVQQIAA